MDLKADIIYKKLTGEMPIKVRHIPSEDTEDLKTVNSFDYIDSCIGEINERIPELEATREVQTFQVFHSSHKYIGGLIIFFKRVLQKFMWWYINPLFVKQSKFNSNVTPIIGRATETISLLSQELNTEEQNTQHLKDEIQTVKDETHTVNNEVRDLGEKIELVQQDYTEKYSDLNKRSNRITQDIDTLGSNVSKFLDQIKNIDTLSENVNTLMDQMNALREEGVFDEHNRNSSVIKQSTSQAGEDGIICHILGMLGIPESECTYIDLGANHAKELSNTYHFYKKGARGVLVEANPELIPELKLFRSGDTILNRCVMADDSGNTKFYCLNGDGLSTFDYDTVTKSIAANPAIHVVATVEVQSITVNEILEKYFTTAPIFMNMDIEGAESEIIQSMDFEKYRPLILCVETIPYRPYLVVGQKELDLVNLLSDRDYIEYAFTGINSIFIDKRRLKEEMFENRV